MVSQRKRRWAAVLAAAVFAGIFPAAKPAAAAEELDALRQCWLERLTGGDYEESGDAITAKVADIEKDGKQLADSLLTENLSQNSDRLWNGTDLSMGDSYDEYTRIARGTSKTLEQIEKMAMAYRVKGSALQGDPELKQKILDSLAFMWKYKYNKDIPRTNRNLSPANPNENWYEWEIRAPKTLVNTLTLMYEEVPEEMRHGLIEAIIKQVPEIGSAATGANRLNNCAAYIIAGILDKDTALVQAGVKAMDTELTYSVSDDGFYEDGSFIQHHQYPYNGGYGTSALASIADIGLLIGSSSFASGNPNWSHIYDWVYQSFEPLQYEGRMMDGVRGRDITGRSNTGYGLLESLVILAQFAPAEDAANYKAMVKRMCENNTVIKPYDSMSSVYAVNCLYEILNDDSVQWRETPNLYQNFGAMDRGVVYRDGYAFSVSMFSDRIRNYESINGANLQGWHTADGATYLYNDDLEAYNDAYWPTVDRYRLAGTTVVKNTQADSALFGAPYAGGVEFDGLYGVNAMQYQSDSGAAYDLQAKKAYFMFDDEILCLGADIFSAKGGGTETIVENRKVDSLAKTLTIDGQTAGQSNGWSQTYTDPSWAHLQGNSADTAVTHSTDIGYYFPQGGTLTARKETRTDSWKTIQSGNGDIKETRQYASLAFEHGTQPSGAGYAYAILPGKTAAETAAYAQNPDFEILENSAYQQTVRDKESGILASVIWSGGQQIENLTCHDPSMVMMREEGSLLRLSVSDPAQTGGVIRFTLDSVFAGILQADPGVCVMQEDGKTTIAVDTAEALGKTFHLVLSREAVQNPPGSPQGLSAQALSPTAVQVRWDRESDAETYYLVYSTQEDGTYLPVPGFDGADNTYMHRSLTPEQTYYYKAAAGTENGVGAYSRAIAVTLPAPPEAEAVAEIADDFESYLPGPLMYQNDWQVTTDPAEDCFADVVEDENGRRFYLTVDKKKADTVPCAEVSKKLIPLEDVVIAEGDFQIPDTGWKNLIVLKAGSTVAVQVYANSSKLWTYNGPVWNHKGAFDDFVFDPDKIYHIKVEYHIRENYFKVYADGVLLTFRRATIAGEQGEEIVLNEIPARTRVSYIDSYSCSIGEQIGGFYMDNLMVTANTAELVDENGNPAEMGSLRPGQHIRFRAEYQNRTETAQTVTAVGALTQEEILLAAQTGSAKVLPGERQTFLIELTVPEQWDAETARAQVLFWSGDGEIKPLSAPLWIRQEDMENFS